MGSIISPEMLKDSMEQQLSNKKSFKIKGTLVSTSLLINGLLLKTNNNSLKISSIKYSLKKINKKPTPNYYKTQ